MSARYRIDDLARLCGSTVRNVRSYQEKGLLPPPVREGRAAYYDDEHLARLRTIASLLERGYSLHNIGELFAGWEHGHELRDVLGLEAALTSPFTDEEPTEIDLEALSRMYGSLDPLMIARAVRLGLVEASDTSGSVRVRSMRLLRAGADLHQAGIPIAALFEQIAQLRADMDRIAERLVRMVLEHVLTPRLESDPSFPELTDLVRRIRPLAKQVMDAEMSRALEQHARAALGEQLTVLAPPARTRRKRARPCR